MITEGILKGFPEGTKTITEVSHFLSKAFKEYTRVYVPLVFNGNGSFPRNAPSKYIPLHLKIYRYNTKFAKPKNFEKAEEIYNLFLRENPDDKLFLGYVFIPKSKNRGRFDTY